MRSSLCTLRIFLLSTETVWSTGPTGAPHDAGMDPWSLWSAILWIRVSFFFPRGSQSEFRSKELGGMVRPKAHITCCLIHGFCTIFTVSPANLRKDSSTMMDIVMHGLHILKADFGVDISRHHVSLQTDNTTREFKNNTCARMLGWLCAHRPFSWLWPSIFHFSTQQVSGVTCFCQFDGFDFHNCSFYSSRLRGTNKWSFDFFGTNKWSFTAQYQE